MRTSKFIRKMELITRLHNMGFSLEEATTLRRIEMALRRWSEQECGDSNNWQSWAIERNEQTQKPYMVTYPHNNNTIQRVAIPDRESGALKRLAKIMKAHPDLTYYHQTDPRGCALYILRKSDLKPGDKIDELYTRGLAVCA